MSRRVVRDAARWPIPATASTASTICPDPEALQAQADAGAAPERPRTELLRDRSRSIITYNDSPDVNFDASINPYRGCEHGCAYCFARPTHEYLGMSAGLDFETRILVKEHAPELLRQELARPGWRPQALGLSGVTDPYQPIERRLRLTRGCLEVLCEARNPVQVITKNYLVTRDVDLLAELARQRLAAVCVSLPTIDAALSRVLEPRTSPAATAPRCRGAARGRRHSGDRPRGPRHPRAHRPRNTRGHRSGEPGRRHPCRLRHPAAAAGGGAAVQRLARGTPAQPGTQGARAGPRTCAGGALNEAAFGSRMRGRGPFAKLIEQLFAGSCRRHGVNAERLRLRTDLFQRPRADAAQLPAVHGARARDDAVPGRGDRHVSGTPRLACARRRTGSRGRRGAEPPAPRGHGGRAAREQWMRHAGQFFGAEQAAPSSPEVFDDPSTGVEVREPPLFQVIMHNDHYTTMDFVVSVLEGVFHKSPSEATQIMLAIHRHGAGRCGVYTREVAEMKNRARASAGARA